MERLSDLIQKGVLRINPVNQVVIVHCTIYVELGVSQGPRGKSLIIVKILDLPKGWADPLSTTMAPTAPNNRCLFSLILGSSSFLCFS